MNWIRPELLAKNPLWITDNQRIIFINIHQDFLASNLRNLFHEQTVRSLIYRPSLDEETCLSNQEE